METFTQKNVHPFTFFYFLSELCLFFYLSLSAARTISSSAMMLRKAK